MALAPLADVDDLAVLVRLPPTDRRVVLALRRASGRFRDAVGYPVTEVKNDRLERMGEGDNALLLKGAPADVTEVKVGGTVLPVTAYVVDPEAGILYRLGGRWRARELVQITYTHGYSQIPEGIEDAVLEHATTLALTYAHVQQETAGTNNMSAAMRATVGVTEKWVDTVATYRLRGRA